MWLIIYKDYPKIKPELVGRVAGHSEIWPPENTCPRYKFEVKEWDGPPPNLGDSMQGILPDLDPTLADPDYADKVQQRADFEGLAKEVATEIAWLESTIPDIDTMTAAEVRDVVKRMARENLEMLKAWRYVLRRLS